MDQPPHTPSEPRGPRLGAASAALAVLILVVYPILAARLGDFYPLCRFHMFADWSHSQSRVVVRTASGELHEVHRYDAWACEGPIDFKPRSTLECADYVSWAPADIRASRHILNRRGEPGQGDPVTVIRQVFRFSEDGGPPEILECPLVRCTARYGATGSTRSGHGG
jgi:hypothetical protein